MEHMTHYEQPVALLMQSLDGSDFPYRVLSGVMRPTMLSRDIYRNEPCGLPAHPVGIRVTTEEGVFVFPDGMQQVLKEVVLPALESSTYLLYAVVDDYNIQLVR